MSVWSYFDPSRDLYINLYKLRDDLFNPESILSADELARLIVLSDPKYRQLFLQSRFYLKKSLEDIIGKKGSELSTTLYGEGKPILKDYSHLVDFSISHKDDYFAIAISRKVLVGLDIEVDRKRSHQKNVSLRFMSQREIAEIQSSESPQKEFLKMWSLKEAVIKLKAGSLFKHASQVHLSLKGPQLLDWPASFGGKESVKVETLPASENVIVSFASADR